MFLFTEQIFNTWPKIGLSYSSVPISNVHPALYFVPRTETHLNLYKIINNKQINSQQVHRTQNKEN